MFSNNQMLGKYQIIKRLGAGGYGTVYLAADSLLNRKVALKIPHQQGEEIVALHEPRIMAVLKHPNIVELITVEENEGSFYMVMEYVQGESLEQQIRQERSFQPQRALGIALGACSAIAFAHSHQVLHRDLRPANILMTKDGVPKVTDFGTSRVLDLQKESFARTRIGSPPYMAPEHFRGKTVFQSDLWSLGITMYEMLTGTVPFYDINPIKIAQAYNTRDIVPPHLRNPQVPKPFSEVVMNCLKVNLGERYISAQILFKELSKLKVEKNISPHFTRPVPSPNIQQQPPALCRYCYRSLPRMATICPYCGEKS